MGEELYTAVVLELKRTMKRFFSFHLLFVLLLSSELLGAILFFTFLTKSFLLAVAIALIFITLFTYLLLRSYRAPIKKQALEKSIDLFFHRFRHAIGYIETRFEHRSLVVVAAHRLVSIIRKEEESFYHPILKGLTSLTKQLGCYFHYFDLFFIQELLLLRAIEEMVRFIKYDPLHVEAHATLSDSYVRLSLLYKERLQEKRWIPKDRNLEHFAYSFKQSIERSKEQLSIILELTLKEGAVQSRIYRLLAKRYRELGMLQEEAQSLEQLLSHQPEDEEALFLLGKSYFELGKHAKGLELYERLERVSSAKASSLIQLYEAFHAYHFRRV